MGAGCTGAVGSSLPDPLHAASPLECSGPHTLGTEFIRHVIEESIRVRYTHAKARATLLKARLGPAQWRGCCRSYACTSRRREREYSRSSWDDDCHQGDDVQVPPAPPLPADNYTLTHGARTTHTALPFTCTRG